MENIFLDQEIKNIFQWKEISHYLICCKYEKMSMSPLEMICWSMA